MIAQLLARAQTPRNSIDRLIDRYGAMAVLSSAILALLRPRKRRPRPPDPCHLSPHMRRDIGLAPQEPVLPRYFDLR